VPESGTLELSIVEQKDGSARRTLTFSAVTGDQDVELVVCVHPFEQEQQEFGVPSPALVSVVDGSTSWILQSGSLSAQLSNDEGRVQLAGVATAANQGERSVGAAVGGPLRQSCFVSTVDEHGERRTREDPEWASDFCRAQQSPSETSLER
jgi:hypothetical protein